MILPFHAIKREHVLIVGGKNAMLGMLMSDLASAGVRVPDGFAVVARAFREHLGRAHIDDEAFAALDAVDARDHEGLTRVARQLRERIMNAPLSDAIAAQIADAYHALSSRYGVADVDVAVRSSATAEDVPEASFAGQQDTYLDVRGVEQLNAAVVKCWASLFSERAIAYRREHGYAHRGVALSVGVQKMVRADLACAGVMVTLDPESGFRDVVQISGAWGLGESVVQGRVCPDEAQVHKQTLMSGFSPILQRRFGRKSKKLVYDDNGGTREVPVEPSEQVRFVLEDSDILTLARWGVAIETRAGRGGRPTPMEIEWAKDGLTGELFVVQARPETAHAKRAAPVFELYRPSEAATPVVTGIAVGSKIAYGPARVIRSSDGLGAFADGEVLVAPMTDPDWEPVIARAAAVITDRGGRTCHAAIVARELGIPCVVGCENATQILATSEPLTVSCAEGEAGHVYRGKVTFKRDVIDPAALPASPIPIMLNVANPDLAFTLGQLPSAGVGLARIEFIISSQIGIHPMALAHPERVVDPATREAIATATRQHASPAEMFVDRLASGIARIGAAFYPRPVLVRFSDFKSNDYARLLGGADIEPVETNPMLGFRGAVRYTHPLYRDAFALECRALLRVRDTFGLRNVKVMIPFCRTLDEARRVLSEMASNGLARGASGLEVYVMAEVPSNVILAAQFCELFDGFSIGSNDLTQLTLGVDRESTLMAQSFDEQDPAVEAMIVQLIDVAHRFGRPVGICGQGPSDYPDLAAFLATSGIDSISVSADALPRVIHQLAQTTRPAKMRRNPRNVVHDARH